MRPDLTQEAHCLMHEAGYLMQDAHCHIAYCLMPNAEDQKKRKFLTNLFVDQLISKLHTGEPCVCQLYRAKNSLSSIQPILGQCMSPKVFFWQKSRVLYCRTDKKKQRIFVMISKRLQISQNFNRFEFLVLRAITWKLFKI